MEGYLFLTRTLSVPGGAVTTRIKAETCRTIHIHVDKLLTGTLSLLDIRKVRPFPREIRNHLSLTNRHLLYKDV